MAINKIHIKNFPFPPSVNEIYANAGKSRVKSRKYKKYLRDCESWRLANLRLINQCKKTMERLDRLHVEYNFNIPSEKIICTSKKLLGKPKMYDVSNRIKAIEDVLFKMLGRDDSYVFSFSAIKNPGDEFGVDVKIGKHGR